MQEEIAHLKELAEQLKACADDLCRLRILDRDAKVAAFLQRPSWLKTLLAGLPPECEVVVKSLLAIGQEELFPGEDANPSFAEAVRTLVEELIPVETFYKDMGGIVGYQCTMLALMRSVKSVSQDYLFHRPPGCDISAPTDQVGEWVLAGIRALDCMAELYPVGGAADRLNLLDPETRTALPAAKLQFCGKTLLEGLIADVQAREYLYYQLFGAQITVPIAMMTSHEKDNHRQILSICEENHWFGRPKSSFHFFCQPAVPLIDREGKWCRSSDGRLWMKPGGHGVIWKMARDSGVFDAWKKSGIKKMLVRQINNPIAGCDYGLLAFAGIGWRENKAFGFASCPRQVESAEGINVLLEQRIDTASTYCLTNVEYCDFKKWGIEDKPCEEGGCYSPFPSNTNILFADLGVIEETISSCPIPGMIVNLKKISPLEEREAARLESTMQNIADCLVDRGSADLKTFLTYNLRRKTISTTKRAFLSGGSPLETPEGCFYDALHNAHDLLTNHCRFDLPPLNSCEEYLEKGPSFFFLYHPALGPLYSIIAQKLRRGVFHYRSELQLGIAELDCEDLHLDGSLKITAEHTMGSRSSDGLIHYNTQTGKCTLRRVTVINRGIDPAGTSCYWKNAFARHELCEIIIHGNGEFYAEDVVLSGNCRIEVEDGCRLRAVKENDKLVFLKEKIQTSSWHWRYRVCDGRILLDRV